LPGEPQPSQKWFDTLLACALRSFDPARPVFIEAESRRIGAISLPLALLDTFHRGACVEIEASRDDRATFLLHDYAHLFQHPESFKQQLSRLIGLHSRERVSGWHALIDEGRGAELARDLIDLHYDPAYSRSSHQNFSELPHATHMLFRPNDADVVEQARALLARLDAAQQAQIERPPIASA
jgi:tRNA 2-selenouridine synthase